MGEDRCDAPCREEELKALRAMLEHAWRNAQSIGANELALAIERARNVAVSTLVQPEGESQPLH